MLNAKHYYQYFIFINSFTFHIISINIIVLAIQYEGFPGGTSGKEPTYQCGRLRFHLWVGNIPWRRAWQPTPIFQPTESHGQRSLVDYGS